MNLCKSLMSPRCTWPGDEHCSSYRRIRLCLSTSFEEYLIVFLGGYIVPCCLAIEGGSIVQKKTGSGISTPASRRLSTSLVDLFSPPASLPARRAAAAAEALDDTMVSPVALYRSTPSDPQDTGWERRGYGKKPKQTKKQNQKPWSFPQNHLC